MDSNKAIDLHNLKSALKSANTKEYIMTNATTNATTTATAQTLNIDTKMVENYYNSLLAANTKVGARTALKSWDQCGLSDGVELICAGKTCTVVRDKATSLGWCQFKFDGKIHQTFSSAETAMRQKNSGGSMESFRISFQKDDKSYSLSIAKLRAGLLNSYISESLKTFDIIKLAKEKSETKVVGEKTRQTLKKTSEALKKSEEGKNAAMRMAAQANAERDEALAELAKLKAQLSK